jgi:hypothetical protein
MPAVQSFQSRQISSSSDSLRQNSRYKDGTTNACTLAFPAVPYRALQSDRFHGGNTGSNPVGDAKSFQYLAQFALKMGRHKKGTSEPNRLWQAAATILFFKDLTLLFGQAQIGTQKNILQPPGHSMLRSRLITTLWASRLRGETAWV